MLFKNIPGQSQIKEYLTRSVNEERVGHAYLLRDNHCAGALPLAIAFAGYLNCLTPANDDACGTCSSCSKVSKLIHPDVHFVFPIVKPSSESKVKCDDFLAQWREYVIQNPYFTFGQWLGHVSDDKKSGMIYSNESEEIYRKLNFKNFEGRYKVMIIWLPEKMHNTGANQLLKILEEPPPTTVFLLVSANTEDIPVTILSRVQHVTVPPVDITSLTKALVGKFALPVDEAERVARLSRGNFAKAMESLQLSKENSINFSLFGTLMRLAYARNFSELLKWIDEPATMSRDRLKSFFDYSIGLSRESYIYNFGNKELVFLNAEEEGFVKKFAPFVNDGNIARVVEEFELAHAHVEQNGNARMVLFDLALKVSKCFKS